MSGGARCRQCGARISFARTANRKLMPLDLSPLSRRDVPARHRWMLREDGLVVHDPDGVSPLVVVVHFTVCPAKLSAAAYAELWETAPMLAGRAQLYGAGKRFH